jgi:hypothetical protein
MLLNGENVDVALTLAQSARQSTPNSPNTADTLAWAYYYKGTYAFARDLLGGRGQGRPWKCHDGVSLGNGVRQAEG